jgi:ABC-type transport system involved in cytochrome bd biosynthesis fused ATPase/permease subunit
VLSAAAGRSVLLITHRTAEADKCQRTISMDAGRTIP